MFAKSLTTVLFVSLLIPQTRAADWPQWLGPTRDGISAGPAIVSKFPLKGVGIRWSRPVGVGWSAPVVASMKVYLFHRLGNDEILECLESDSGKLVWEHRSKTRYVDDFGFDEGPRATPTIADGRIFTLGANGDLTAVKQATGERIWQRALQKDYAADKGFFEGQPFNRKRVEHTTRLGNDFGADSISG